MPKALEGMWNKVNDIEKYMEQEQLRFDRMRQDKPSKAANYFVGLISHDPFYKAYMPIYMNYLRPMRLERNRRRNEKLSRLYNYPKRTLPEPVDYASS